MTSVFAAKTSKKRSFDICFDVSQNKLLKKKSHHRWLFTPRRAGEVKQLRKQCINYVLTLSKSASRHLRQYIENRSFVILADRTIIYMSIITEKKIIAFFRYFIVRQDIIKCNKKYGIHWKMLHLSTCRYIMNALPVRDFEQCVPQALSNLKHKNTKINYKTFDICNYMTANK